MFGPDGIRGGEPGQLDTRRSLPRSKLGGIKGEDLPAGISAVKSQLLNPEGQPLVWIETRLVTEGWQSRLLLVEEGHPV